MTKYSTNLININVIFQWLFILLGAGSSYGGYGAAAPAPVQTKLKKQAPIVRDFFCSLEELYNGCEKRMRVTKRVIGSTGVAKHEKKDLVIPVRFIYLFRLIISLNSSVI